MIGKGYIKNHLWQEGEDGIQENRSNTVYEVIRLIDGIPLFLEDHVKRLCHSLSIMGISLENPYELLERDIQELARKNQVQNCNLRLEYWTEETLRMQMYFIESFYPQKEIYVEGVAVGLAYVEREMPNGKIYRPDYKKYVTERIQETNSFEVLLVDKNGMITEGSRSNFFYLKEGKLFTAPSDKVLSGVTRNHVLQCAENIGITICEGMLSHDNVERIQGCFLTGTSIGILPIKNIERVFLNSSKNDIISALMREFQEHREQMMKHKVVY